MVVSVFYIRSSWNNLFTQVIKPFIIQHQSNIKSWCIYFSSTHGDHITLAIKTVDNVRIEKNFLETAGNFLSLNPSEKNIIEFPLEDFFMDYPNNSIQFNKSKSLAHSWDNSSQKDRQQAISKALIEALGNDVIDMESIYTFLIYMQLGIIQSAYPDIRIACSLAPNILICWGNTEDIENEKADYEFTGLIQLFKNNKEIFRKIIKDVWKEHYNSELRWLYEWESACRKFIKTDFSEEFISLSTLLCKHLGLNEKMVEISFQLIFNAFKQLPEHGQPVN
ncbi:MAG TPA: hypothetical protein DIT07_10065 [Sphingobacteriaceae bacterium]|nr:hypothetical protein [Sphingobacteriaceae bacterium]